MKYLSIEKLVDGKYVHVSKEECDLEEPLFSDPKSRIILKEYTTTSEDDVIELEDFTRFLPEYYVKDPEVVNDNRPLYTFHYLSLHTRDKDGKVKILKGNYSDSVDIIRTHVTKKAHTKEEVESFPDFSRWLTLFDPEYQEGL